MIINYKDTPKLLIKKPLLFIIISVISGNITYLISRNSYIGVIVFHHIYYFLRFYPYREKF